MSWQSTPGSRRLVLTSMFCLVSTQQAHASQEHAAFNAGENAARAQNQLAAEARREAMERARDAMNDAREAMQNARRAQLELRTPGFNAIDDMSGRAARMEIRNERRGARQEMRIENMMLRNSARGSERNAIENSQATANSKAAELSNKRADRHAANATNRETRPPNVVSTISDTGVLDRVIDLDLTSADSNIVLGRKLFRGEDSVTIRVGTEEKTFTAGSQVTAGEYVAIRQKLDGGSQLLELNAHGSAIGGSFELGSVVSRQVDDLVIPVNVSGIEYFTKNNATIRVGGDLTNYGSLIAASVKKNVDSGTIAGENIFNVENGIIATGFPEQQGDSTIISGGNNTIDLGVVGGRGRGRGNREANEVSQPEPQFPNNLNLNLTLKADEDVVNHGKIAGNRSITIDAGGSITNGTPGQVSYEPLPEPETNPPGTIGGGTVVGGGVTFPGGGTLYPNGSIVYSEKNDPVYRQRDLLNGSITARGDINLIARADSGLLRIGEGDINNYGNITAGANHNFPRAINISSDKGKDVDIVATGGVFKSEFGSINVRDASFKGAADINMSGGDYLSKQLNLFSGSGAIEGNVGKVTGTLNTVAGIEHFYAATETLTIGNNCITGDPTFANTTGDIQIVGLNTFGEAVAFLANGDITANSTTQIVANGFNVYMIAGAAITVSAGPETGSVPGTPIGAGTTATVDFSSGNGGSINLSASNVGTIIDTSSNTGNGGAIVLAARANGTTGGFVNLNMGATLDSSSSFSDANGGNITILAGANPTTPSATIQGGNFISSALAGTGTAGNITIETAQPTATGGSSITFDSLGQVIAGGPVTAAAVSSNGQINVGTITSQASTGGNAINVTAGNSVATGAITTANSVTVSSGTSIDASSIVSGGDILLNTPALVNDGTITSSKVGGSITVRSATGLSLAGTGDFSLTGGGAGSILLDAGANNALAFTTSHTFNPGATGSVTWQSEDEGGSITIAPAITLTVNDGGTLNIGTPKLRFLGNGSLIDAAAASTININSGGGPNSLTIELPDNGSATIVTTGGSIRIEPTDGMDLAFTNAGGTGLAELNLNGGPVLTETSAASTFVNQGVALRSNNALTMDAGSNGGISGYGFQPYVGDYFNGNSLPQFNAYDLATVKALLQQLKNDGITNVSTYSQGSFIFAGQFYGPETSSAGSNKYIIQAAYELGMTVSAGAFQQGVDGDSFNIEDTKAEIQYILEQAQKYPGTVKEIIVCNESIFGLNSTNQLIQLINDAKVMRDNTPVSAGSDTKFNSSTLPITTRQQWGALAGVDSLPNGDPLKPVMKTLVNTVEGHIYGNMYAYFDGALPQSYDTSPNGQQTFVTAVTNSMTGTLNAFRTAFSNQGVTTEIRIGETGWPSLGLRLGPLPPAPALGDLTLAKWYYQAMREWTATNSVSTTYFQSYDQPWQTVPLANVPTTPGSSEGYFGLYRAIGSGTATQYTLTSIESKFGPGSANSLGSNTHMLSNDGIIAANNVAIETQRLDNDGTISAMSVTGGVTVNSASDLNVSGNGTINRTGGGTGGIAFTSAGANDIVVEGSHTFDAGAGNPVSFNAIADGASFTLAQGSTINLPTNNTAFSVNAEHIIYNGTINDNAIANPATTITFNSADSSTISNSVGDLDLRGVTVNVATGHLAILAKGSIINTGEVANINVSSNVGAGGNVLMIAGHSFQTVDLEGEDAVYALDDVSTSTGNVVLTAAGHEININTSGATNAGNIEIYANGSVALNNVTATGGTGIGGNLTIRGTGVTVQGAINTAGAIGSGSGSVDIQTGTVVHSGVDVHGGKTESGIFSLASRSGNITVSDITTSEGSVLLQTDGAGTIQLTGAMPVAHDISLLAGTGTLNLPTNTITAVENALGNGGAVRVSASSFTNPAAVILNAVGTNNGGFGSYTNTSTSDLTLDSNSLQIHSAGFDGGTANVSAGGNLTLYPQEVLDIQPTNTEGNGASITLTAGTAAPGFLLIVGDLSVAAAQNGDKAGNLSLNSNSPLAFQIGGRKIKNGVTGSLTLASFPNFYVANSLSIANRSGGINIAVDLSSRDLVAQTVSLSTIGATKGDIKIRDMKASSLFLSVEGNSTISSNLLSTSNLSVIGGAEKISLTAVVNHFDVTSDGSVDLNVVRSFPHPGSQTLNIGASSVGGDLIVKSAKSIEITGNITASNISFKTEGGIDINSTVSATAPNGRISLEAVNTLSSSSPDGYLEASVVNLSGGVLGESLADPLLVNADSIQLRSQYRIYLNNLNADPVTLSKVLVKDTFDLKSAGSVLINSKLSLATNIAIDTTSGGGDIVVNKGLGGANTPSIHLTTDSGDVSGRALRADSLFISSSSGNIGSADSPLQTMVKGLSAITGGSVYVSNSQKETVLGLSSGKEFFYSTSGDIRVINYITAQNGSLSIISKGSISVAGGLLSNSNGPAGSGAITLQSLKKSGDSINIGGVAIATSGVGGGDVKIFVGKKEPNWTNTLPDGANGNLVVTTSGGGQVFVNTEFVDATGGSASLNAIGKNVYISGASKRNKVTIGVGAAITADPPVAGIMAMEATRYADTASVPMAGAPSVHTAALGFETAVGSTAAPNTTLNLNPLPSNLNAINSFNGLGFENVALPALSNASSSNSSVLTTETLTRTGLTNAEVSESAVPEETQFLGKTSERIKEVEAVLHYDATSKHVLVSTGNKLFAPSSDTTVETPVGTISIAKNSLVLVMVQPDSVSVFDLHDEHKGAVRISEGTRSIVLHPGKQATITKSTASEFHVVNPSDHFGYRHMNRKVFGEGTYLFSSEVSVPSLISATKTLKSLLTSKHSVENRIAKQLVKTAAVLNTIDTSTTPYDTMPHPRLMVCNK